MRSRRSTRRCPNGDLASNVRFMETNLPSQMKLKCVGRAGDEVIIKTALSLAGWVSKCCRNRRPKVRPVAVRDVLQNQDWGGLRIGA
jgi:hypothetical protein